MKKRSWMYVGEEFWWRVGFFGLGYLTALILLMVTD